MGIISKMIRMAGRGDDGNAKAIRTNNDGYLKTDINDSTIAVPVDLQYHDLGDALPVYDEDVKAQVEALKAEVTAIKNGTTNVSDSEAQARLQAIEGKLNGTIETSVTGSNVEFGIQENFNTYKKGFYFAENKFTLDEGEGEEENGDAGYFEDNDDHIVLYASNANVSELTARSYVSFLNVDFSEVNRLFIEWECDRSGNGASARLYVGETILTRYDSFERSVDLLDVTSVSDFEDVKIFSWISSTSTRSAEVKIYKVWGVK